MSWVYCFSNCPCLSCVISFETTSSLSLYIITSPTVQEVQNLKSRCQQGSALSLQVLGKNFVIPFSSFYGLLTILNISWLVEASLGSLPLSLDGLLPMHHWIHTQAVSSYKDNNYWIRAHPNPEQYYNVVTFAKTLFSNKVTLHRCQDLRLKYLFVDMTQLMTTSKGAGNIFPRLNRS